MVTAREVGAPQAPVSAEGVDQLMDEKVRVAVRIGFVRCHVTESDLDIHIRIDCEGTRHIDSQSLRVAPDKPTTMI